MSGDGDPLYSRSLWALMIALDRLPWPWGEDILARLFGAVALVRGSRRRPALAWASRQPEGRGLRLALAVCAFRGRWVARAALLGVRSPDALIRRAVIRGEEHLTSAPEGTILLGFHLGPPQRGRDAENPGSEAGVARNQSQLMGLVE